MSGSDRTGDLGFAPRPALLASLVSPLLCVEASAGTGKTYFLEHRVADLVLAGATIDQILVVTFTEKATAELRGRIRALLERLRATPAGPGLGGDSWPIDDAARLRLRAAIADFDRAPIHTIHGFCQRLLLEDAFAGHRLFDQTQVPDRAAFDDAFYAALRDVLAIGANGALLRAFLAAPRSKGLAGLLDLLWRCARAGGELEDGDDPGGGEACVRAFLPIVAARVRAGKRRLGQFDFQDMLRLVWEGLDGPRGDELADRLRARHPWALIDEFQDTDELQWNIFRKVYLTRRSASPAGGDAAGGLTIVGDPKQAIYSFRGADVFTYLQARREMLAAGAQTVVLDENRRSSPGVVAAYNALFTSVDPPFFTGSIAYSHPVKATGAIRGSVGGVRDIAPVVVLEPTPAGGDGKPAGDEIRTALATRFAEETARIIGLRGDLHRLWLHDGATQRPIEAHDVFVLTRSRSESLEVAEVMRAHGVPCALFQQEGLFATREAEDIADLLEAIAAPRDRSARLRAWMTSFFDVPLAELGNLTDLPDSHPLAARLHEWRALAGRLDYDALLRRILDDTRWVERQLLLGAGERAITNVLHVFELLAAEVTRSRCEIHELAARLRRWMDEGPDVSAGERDVQRLETERDAVQIMTIHRAKGLEAAVVFVHGGYWSGVSGDVHVFHDEHGQRKVALGDGDGKARAATEAREENQRLMYVALTRAKIRLYLPLITTSKVKVAQQGSYFPVQRCLEALVAKRGGPVSPGLFFREPVPVAPRRRPRALAAADVADWTPTPPPAAADDEVADRLLARAGFAVTSYTRMKHAAAAAQARSPVSAHGERLTPRATPPREVDADEFRGDDASAAAPGPGELPGGAASGLFLHDILEHVDFASARGLGAAAWAALPEVARVVDVAARRHAVAVEHRDHGARLVHAALTREVVAAGEVLPPLAWAPRVAKEVEFVFPLPPGRGGERGFVKGFIDLLVAWDDRLWVVDYKSDVLADLGEDAARRHVDEHYAVQVRLYAIAAARMLGLRDAGDHAARFGGLLYWFLRPSTICAIQPGPVDLAAWERTLDDDALLAGAALGGRR